MKAVNLATEMNLNETEVAIFAYTTDLVDSSEITSATGKLAAIDSGGEKNMICFKGSSRDTNHYSSCGEKPVFALRGDVVKLLAKEMEIIKPYMGSIEERRIGWLTGIVRARSKIVGLGVNQDNHNLIQMPFELEQFNDFYEDNYDWGMDRKPRKLMDYDLPEIYRKPAEWKIEIEIAPPCDPSPYLYLVKTSRKNFERRNFLRAFQEFDKNSTKIENLPQMRFLLGKGKSSEDPSIEKFIKKEMKEHGDLVVGKFIDEYDNLPHKTMAGYTYFAENCMKPHKKQYVMFIDDDVLLDVEHLDSYFKQPNASDFTCFGFLGEHARPNRWGKYNVTIEQWAGGHFFPKFCSGPCAGMTAKMSEKIYEAASTTDAKGFKLEDVLFTGIIRTKAGIPEPSFQKDVCKHFDQKTKQATEMSMWQYIRQLCARRKYMSTIQDLEKLAIAFGFDPNKYAHLKVGLPPGVSARKPPIVEKGVSVVKPVDLEGKVGKPIYRKPDLSKPGLYQAPKPTIQERSNEELEKLKTEIAEEENFRRCRDTSLLLLLHEHTMKETGPGSFLVNLDQQFGTSGLEWKLITNAKGFELKGSDLYTKSEIDREKICPTKKNEDCIINLKLYSFKNQGIYELSLTIEDVNDHKPVFEDEPIEIFFSEDAQVGQRKMLFSATDEDSDEFGIDRYSLKDDSETFNLVEYKNPDDTKVPQLILKRTLDREEKDNYELALTAFDKGERASTVKVLVNVVDVNDNRPTWQGCEGGSVSISIKEGLAIGERLPISIVATDADDGLNGQITYRYSSTTNTEARKVFNLNPQTAEITILESPDFENVQSHHLYLEAVDNGQEPKVAYCILNVNVLDENDEEPEVQVTPLNAEAGSNSSVIFLKEDFEVGGLFAIVLVTDKDNRGEEVTASIDNSAFELVKFEVGSFQLLLAEALDYEQTTVIQATISATDGEQSPLTKVYPLEIVVQDVNDNGPKFQLQEYQVKLSESEEIGYVLLNRFSATDEDAGENGCIDYELTGKDSYLFGTEVEGDCGPVSIVLRQKIDYDEQQLDSESAELGKMELQLVAKDRGFPQKTSATSIFVELIDENDNQPTFSKSKYSFEFPETAEKGDIIGIITAEDNDLSPAFSDIKFDFKPEKSQLSTPPNPFELEMMADKKSAQIVLKRQLDFEDEGEKNNKKWEFVITAENPEMQGMTVSEAHVKIQLLDVNEFAPSIEFKKFKTLRTNKGKSYAVVEEQANVTVSRLEVSDEDASTTAEDVSIQLFPTSNQFFKLQETSKTGKYLLDYQGNHADGLFLVEIAANDNFSPSPKNSTIRFPVFINTRASKNATEIAAIVDETQLEDLDNDDFADILSANIVFIGGGAAVFLILLIVLVCCCCRARCWSKKKQGHQEAYNVSMKKGGHDYLASSKHGATLDSRNDFEGNWTKPYDPRAMQSPGQSSYHSGNDSGKGESIPTQNYPGNSYNFPAPPPAVGYNTQPQEIGDEEWMGSLLRQNNNQIQEGAATDTFIAAPMSKSSSSKLIYSPPSSQSYQSLSRRGNNNPHRPHFSTFLDEEEVRSETSSISVALLNGHMSPHYDSDIASNAGTLNRNQNNRIQYTYPSPQERDEAN
ncbi:Oidioi.mRNA.OKI2018_I69.PAR.g10047.t1.cds [Oikopleura dioica]|uniref:Oidioi.mRNA.OKI2018_I69.PAR.g10047.t1.cds n=2 Tax=Oikopleura dioica TaxID=34765 RepID=A0ABN7RRQ3_OIKDI|nr:Oidioi.mRNA.OKI2018_I69.PAR.g10047.t1.cds [Oikopleura dioica]